jgi:hypothetical protein
MGEMAMAIRLHRKPVNFVVLVAMLTGFSGLAGAGASTATAPAAPATAPVVQTIRPSTVCWPGLPLSEAFAMSGSGLANAAITTDAPISLPPNSTTIDPGGRLLTQVFHIGTPPPSPPEGVFHLFVNTPSGSATVSFTLTVCTADVPVVQSIQPGVICWPSQPLTETFVLGGKNLLNTAISTDAPIYLPPNGTTSDPGGSLVVQPFQIGAPPPNPPQGTFHLFVNTPGGATAARFRLLVCP